MPDTPYLARDVQDRLAHAHDTHLNQVVALLDQMEHRGAADALLAPLRPRLAQLAPARPLTLPRLLFQPLDPVIEPGAQWRPGSAAVPRPALAPLASAVLDAIRPCADEVRRMIAGRGWSDAAAVSAAGALLWPAAAVALPGLDPVPGWAAAGLEPAWFNPLRDTVAAVLRHGPALHGWRAGPGEPRTAASILADTQARHPGALPVVLAVLLANAGAAPGVLAAAAALPGTAPDAAVEQVLARTEHGLSTLPAATLAGACAQAMHAAILLDAVDGPGAQPRFRRLAQQARRTADTACRARVLQALDQDVLPALAADVLDDAAATELEAAARGIRKLSTAGYRLGSAASYAALLNRTAAGVLASPGGASRMDRLRVAELLVGAEAALRLG